MNDHQHLLVYRVALPMSAPEDKVHGVIAKTREYLKRLAGPFSRNHQFRHKVEDKEARAGGPTGRDILVRYVQVMCRYNGLLTDATMALKARAEQLMLERAVAEAGGVINVRSDPPSGEVKVVLVCSYTANGVAVDAGDGDCTNLAFIGTCSDACNHPPACSEHLKEYHGGASA